MKLQKDLIIYHNFSPLIPKIIDKSLTALKNFLLQWGIATVTIENFKSWNIEQDENQNLKLIWSGSIYIEAPLLTGFKAKNHTGDRALYAFAKNNNKICLDDIATINGENKSLYINEIGLAMDKNQCYLIKKTNSNQPYLDFSFDLDKKSYNSTDNTIQNIITDINSTSDTTNKQGQFFSIPNYNIENKAIRSAGYDNLTNTDEKRYGFNPPLTLTSNITSAYGNQFNFQSIPYTIFNSFGINLNSRINNTVLQIENTEERVLITYDSQIKEIRKSDLENLILYMRFPVDLKVNGSRIYKNLLQTNGTPIDERTLGASIGTLDGLEFYAENWPFYCLKLKEGFYLFTDTYCSYNNNIYYYDSQLSFSDWLDKNADVLSETNQPELYRKYMKIVYYENTYVQEEESVDPFKDVIEGNIEGTSFNLANIIMGSNKIEEVLEDDYAHTAKYPFFYSTINNIQRTYTLKNIPYIGDKKFFQDNQIPTNITKDIKQYTKNGYDWLDMCYIKEASVMTTIGVLKGQQLYDPIKIQNWAKDSTGWKWINITNNDNPDIQNLKNPQWINTNSHGTLTINNFCNIHRSIESMDVKGEYYACYYNTINGSFDEKHHYKDITKQPALCLVGWNHQSYSQGPFVLKPIETKIEGKMQNDFWFVENDTISCNLLLTNKTDKNIKFDISVRDDWTDPDNPTWLTISTNNLLTANQTLSQKVTMTKKQNPTLVSSIYVEIPWHFENEETKNFLLINTTSDIPSSLWFYQSRKWITDWSQDLEDEALFNNNAVLYGGESTWIDDKHASVTYIFQTLDPETNQWVSLRKSSIRQEEYEETTVEKTGNLYLTKMEEKWKDGLFRLKAWYSVLTAPRDNECLYVDANLYDPMYRIDITTNHIISYKIKKDATNLQNKDLVYYGDIISITDITPETHYQVNASTQIVPVNISNTRAASSYNKIGILPISLTASPIPFILSFNSQPEIESLEIWCDSETINLGDTVTIGHLITFLPTSALGYVIKPGQTFRYNVEDIANDNTKQALIPKILTDWAKYSLKFAIDDTIDAYEVKDALNGNLLKENDLIREQGRLSVNAIINKWYEADELLPKIVTVHATSKEQKDFTVDIKTKPKPITLFINANNMPKHFFKATAIERFGIPETTVTNGSVVYAGQKIILSCNHTPGYTYNGRTEWYVDAEANYNTRELHISVTGSLDSYMLRVKGNINPAHIDYTIKNINGIVLTPGESIVTEGDTIIIDAHPKRGYEKAYEMCSPDLQNIEQYPKTVIVHYQKDTLNYWVDLNEREILYTLHVYTDEGISSYSLTSPGLEYHDGDVVKYSNVIENVYVEPVSIGYIYDGESSIRISDHCNVTDKTANISLHTKIREYTLSSKTIEHIDNIEVFDSYGNKLIFDQSVVKHGETVRIKYLLETGYTAVTRDEWNQTDIVGDDTQIKVTFQTFTTWKVPAHAQQKVYTLYCWNAEYYSYISFQATNMVSGGKTRYISNGGKMYYQDQLYLTDYTFKTGYRTSSPFQTTFDTADFSLLSNDVISISLDYAIDPQIQASIDNKRHLHVTNPNVYSIKCTLRISGYDEDSAMHYSEDYIVDHLITTNQEWVLVDLGFYLDQFNMDFQVHPDTVTVIYSDSNKQGPNKSIDLNI